MNVLKIYLKAKKRGNYIVIIDYLEWFLVKIEVKSHLLYNIEFRLC